MKDFIRKIVEIYKPFKKAVIIMFLFIACAQALPLASPYIYGRIIDGIVSALAMKVILVLAFISLVLYILQNVVDKFQEKFEVNNLDFDVSRYVSKTTLEKTFKFSIGQHNNENSGVKQSVINKGEHSLTTLAYTMLYDVFPLIARITFTVGALMYLSIILGTITLVSVICFVGITIYLNGIMKSDLKIFEDLRDNNNKMHTEILRNVELVQVNAQEDKVIEDFDKEVGKLCSFGKRMWLRYISLNFLRNLIIGVTMFLVIIVGVHYVYKGTYTPGYLVVFISWSYNAFDGLGAVGKIHRQCMVLCVAVKKYFTMLDIEPEVKIIPNPVRPDDFNGSIEFKNVSFKYPVRDHRENKEEVKSSSQNKYEALSNVSFTIEKNQKVAFVGPSGAGKSTLVHLMLRSYDPDEGQVIIDNNDLRVLDLQHYRRSIGLVEQNILLFDETLRYNMVFGLNGKGVDVTNDELYEIAHISCVDKFYHRLEKGFDTIIGEKGIKLSGGERQRVGIARALIKDPKILIFDEATSNLDTENESLIRQAIENASEGRTIIIIAHRLSTIKDVDKIFVMDEGRIVGKGRHDELLDTCIVYKNLVNKQVVTI